MFLLLQASCLTASLSSYFIGLAFNLASATIHMAYPEIVYFINGVRTVYPETDYFVKVGVFGHVGLRVVGGSYGFFTWLTFGFWCTSALLIPVLAFYINKNLNRTLTTGGEEGQG